MEEVEYQQELLSQYQGSKNHEQSMRDFAQQVNAPVEVHSTDMKQPIEVFGNSSATPVRVFRNAKDRSYNLITGGQPKLQAPPRKQRIHVNCNPDVQVLWQVQDVLMDQITTAVLTADVQVVQWEDRFQLWKELVAKNGKMPSSKSKDPVEMSLGRWAVTQRHLNNKKKLSPVRFQLLNSCPDWRWKNEDTFLKNFELWEEFVAKYDKTPSMSSKDPVERYLGNWASAQRQLNHKNKMSADRFELLNSCNDWRWYDSFSKKIEKFKEFVAKNESMPSQHSTDALEQSLGTWACRQRQQQRKGKLNQEKTQLLNSVNLWYWEVEDSFLNKFQEFKEFVAKNDGNLPSVKSQDPVEKTLGHWGVWQRHLKKKGKLSSEQIQLLQSVSGWKWKIDDYFSKNFEKFKEFVAKNGRMPSQKSTDVMEKSLGTWACRQRQQQRKGKLNQEKTQLLNSVNLWYWEVEDTFLNKFQEFKEFVAKNGRMPYRSDDPAERSLGTWIHEQRTNYRRNKMSPEKIELMESISIWQWRVDPFPKKFQEFKEFVEKNGNLPSHHSENPAERSLGFWISDQRRKFTKDKLSKEHVELLESVPGWWWSTEKTTDAPKDLTEQKTLFDCCVAALQQLLGPHSQVNSPLLKFMKTGQKKPEVQLLFPQTEFMPMMEAMLAHIKATNLTKAWLGAVAIKTAADVVYALETVDSAIKLGKKVGLWNFNGESFEHLKKTYNLLCVAQESNGQWSVGSPVTGTVHFAVYQEVPKEKKRQLEPKEKPVKPAKRAKKAKTATAQQMIEEPTNFVQPPEAAQPTKPPLGEEPVQLLQEVQQCNVAEPVEEPVHMAKPSAEPYAKLAEPYAKLAEPVARKSKDLAEQVAAHARKEEQRVQENARLRQQILELTDQAEVQRLKRQLGLEADTYAEDEHSPEHKAWKQSMNRVFAQLVKDHTQAGDKILYLDGPSHQTTNALQGLQRDLYVANWDAETCAAITGATVLHGDVKDLLLGPWQHTDFSAVYLDVCTGHSHIIIEQLAALRKMPTVLGFTLTRRGEDSQVARVREIERAILNLADVNRAELQYVRNLQQFRAENFCHNGVVTEFYLLR